ncbi:MAG: hypothetical protein C4320_01120 [Armatimonadota bacterium]
MLYNRILMGLGFLGMFIAGTLTLAKASGRILPCGLEGSCQAVSEHPSAYWFGIPVAYFGLGGYVFLTLLAVIREATGRETSRLLVLPGYIASIFGFFSSAFLQYVSFMVIGEKCTWCIASALTMLATLIAYTLLFASGDGRIISGSVATSHRTRSWPAILGLFLLTAGATVAIPAVFGAREAIKEVKVASVAQLIPTPRNELGPATAPVTIVEFADFCCPSCRKTAEDAKGLVDKYPGKIRLVFRHFPLLGKPGHEMAFPAAIASEFAADKGKFWQFHKLIMGTSEPVSKPEEILSAAGQLGLDELALSKIIDGSPSPQLDRVYRDFTDAQKLKVDGTPAFIVQVPGREPLKVKFDALESAFKDGELAQYVR